MTKKRSHIHVSRRSAVLSLAAAMAPIKTAAATARELTWEELIPEGVPYAEIIGEGFMDVEADIWRPIYDGNAKRLNESLNGDYIRMPGYVVPLEFDSSGVSSFVLVPYFGACIHTPPPPANQLVFITTENPWPSDKLWEPVWVRGTIRTQLQTTEVAETGYALEADHIETYIW